VRISAPLLTLAGTAAGTAAAVVAYQSAAGSATAPASAPAGTPTPAAVTSFKPCENGWKLVGNACVRVRKKVVVVHDLPAPAAPQARAATARSSSDGSGDGSGDDANEAAENENENEVENGSDEGVEQEDAPDQEDVGGDD